MPRRLVDLHTHSSRSDGQYAPADLVAAADARKLAALALTDHDTLAGLAEAADAAEDCGDLVFVCGIEVSASYAGGSIHILGLGVDPASDELAGLTARLRRARGERNPKMLARLRELGLDIEMDDLLAEVGEGGDDGPIVSRLHMARALVRKGLASSQAEAFERYVGSQGQAYVEKDRLSPREVVEAIHRAGGLAGVAHPGLIPHGNRLQAGRILQDLKSAGMDFVEAVHSEHSPAETRMFLSLAKELGMEVTGGSDFHGQAKPDVRLGVPRMPLSLLGGRLRERIGL